MFDLWPLRASIVFWPNSFRNEGRGLRWTWFEPWSLSTHVNMWAGLVWSISTSTHNWTQLTTTCSPDVVQHVTGLCCHLVFSDRKLQTISSYFCLSLSPQHQQTWWLPGCVEKKRISGCAKNTAPLECELALATLIHSSFFSTPDYYITHDATQPLRGINLSHYTQLPLEPQKALYYFFHVCSRTPQHFKGALCNFGDQMLMRREGFSLADFFLPKQTK